MLTLIIITNPCLPQYVHIQCIMLTYEAQSWTPLTSIDCNWTLCLQFGHFAYWKLCLRVISQLLHELACGQCAKGQLQTQGGYSLTVPY